MRAMQGATQSKIFSASRLVEPSVEAPAAQQNGPIPPQRPLLGKLDPFAFIRYVIAFFIGVTATLAWQFHGGVAREMNVPASSTNDQQGNAPIDNGLSVDLDLMRQSIDRLAADMGITHEQIARRIDRLSAGQEQLTSEIIKLQPVEQYVLYKSAEHPSWLAPAPARNLAPRRWQPVTAR